MLWLRHKGVDIPDKVLACNSDTNTLELETTCIYFDTNNDSYQ